MTHQEVREYSSSGRHSSTLRMNDSYLPSILGRLSPPNSRKVRPVVGAISAGAMAARLVEGVRHSCYAFGRAWVLGRASVLAEPASLSRHRLSKPAAA